MPQMMPMYWLLLMIYFMLIYMFFNFLLYYCYININYLKNLIINNKNIYNKLILKHLC